LLKIISKITYPDSGTLKVNGKLVSLINLYAGFHPELSGIENIKLNALLIGMTSKEIKKKEKSIVNFANIGEFIYAPMHTYSTGMRLRLGFSVAIHADPDILILDEPTSNIDMKGQHQIYQLLKELNKNMTIIVVSHDISIILGFTSKVAYINKKLSFHNISNHNNKGLNIDKKIDIDKSTHFCEVELLETLGII